MAGRMLRNATVLVLAGFLTSAVAAADTGDNEDTEEEPERVTLEIGDYRVALGGQYRVMANSANFIFHAPGLATDEPARRFVNQRFRTWLNIHDGKDADHGVYLQIEIGHVLWGDDFDFPKTYSVNGSEVGLELRRGYLWIKPSKSSLLRVGILDWHDRFGERSSFKDPLWAVDTYDAFRAPLANSIWDFNVGGLAFDFEPRESWHASIGTIVLQAGDRTLTGEGGALLFTGDLDRETTAGVFGASAYYVRDRGGYSYGDFGGPRRRTGDVAESSWDLWTGARAHWSWGRVHPSAFVIFNTGRVDAPAWTHAGWAFKAAAVVDAGRGDLSLQAYYSTGNDGSELGRSGEFRTIAQSVRDDFGAQSYWSLLGLTSPRGPSDVNDLGVSLQNRGLGLVTVQGSYSRSLSAAVTGYLALGWLRAAEENPVSRARDMGTEVLGEVHWALSGTGAFGVDAGGAYLWTGDFYKTTPGARTPDDLYELYVRFQLEF